MQKIDLSQIRFLLIDPNPLSIELTQDVLVMMGARQIRKCARSDRAIEALRGDPLDIVITEWNTEPMSGLELIELIRTAPDSPNRLMPILLMSARSEQEYVLQARDRGLTEFLASRSRWRPCTGASSRSSPIHGRSSTRSAISAPTAAGAATSATKGPSAAQRPARPDTAV